MNTIAYYTQVIVALVIFVSIITVVLRFTQSVQKKKFSGEIKVIDRRTVDTGIHLLILSIRDQDYLFSIGGKEVRLVEKLPLV